MVFWVQVFIWLGSESSQNEQSSAQDVIRAYLEAAKRSPDTPVTTVCHPCSCPAHADVQCRYLCIFSAAMSIACILESNTVSVCMGTASHSVVVPLHLSYSLARSGHRQLGAVLR